VLLLVLLALYAAAVLVAQGLAIYLAYRMPRIDATPYPGPGAPPSVGVVIAARDEAEAIGGCLDDLLAQDYPGLDIVVVDGRSSDGTADIARMRSGVRVLEETPLPAGWVGKNWACRIGAEATHSTFVLFTDADVRYHPLAVASAVAWAERDRADLVTLATRIETQSFWERVVLPLYTQLVLTYFRAPLVNDDRSGAAVANGQFLLVRRDAYEAIGGHSSIGGFVLEDVALARRFRAAGKRMRFGWAPGLVSTRMYRDRSEMFEGLLRSIHDTHFSAARQVGFLAALVGLFWLPLLVLPLGLLLGSLGITTLGVGLWIALFGKHAAFAKAVGGRARYGLLFPVAVGFYVALVATSLSHGLKGAPLRWKGRDYPLTPGSPDAGRPPTP
jgi:chlorobactene glucosyltransferase